MKLSVSYYLFLDLTENLTEIHSKIFNLDWLLETEKLFFEKQITPDWFCQNQPFFAIYATRPPHRLYV